MADRASPRPRRPPREPQQVPRLQLRRAPLRLAPQRSPARARDPRLVGLVRHHPLHRRRRPHPGRGLQVDAGLRRRSRRGRCAEDRSPRLRRHPRPRPGARRLAPPRRRLRPGEKGPRPPPRQDRPARRARRRRRARLRPPLHRPGRQARLDPQPRHRQRCAPDLPLLRVRRPLRHRRPGSRPPRAAQAHPLASRPPRRAPRLRPRPATLRLRRRRPGRRPGLPRQPHRPHARPRSREVGRAPRPRPPLHLRPLRRRLDRLPLRARRWEFHRRPHDRRLVCRRPLDEDQRRRRPPRHELRSARLRARRGLRLPDGERRHRHDPPPPARRRGLARPHRQRPGHLHRPRRERSCAHLARAAGHSGAAAAPKRKRRRRWWEFWK